ncbi:MAG: aminoglycoside 3'-phosphotransferase [Ruminococcus sp.]|nr:aminoglycoside 3'-phosphotransferase [Ruminococcus sp.]
MEFILPDNIKRYTGDKPFKTDNIGMSGSAVLEFENMVLKIENYRETNDKTVEVMKWLVEKIPVPEVMAYEVSDGKSYLLMSKVEGKMSCDEYYLENPDELLELLCEALEMLWAVDISECPRDRGLDTELEEAFYRIENGLVDVENTMPETFGEGGFENPMALYKWLCENKPKNYEPVLSHGDFCLPNVFLKDGKVAGFIDLGDTGTGDKWRDIALLYRSLKWNFDGTFGGKVYENFSPDMLFDYLKITPDYQKLRYYILLDELF